MKVLFIQKMAGISGSEKYYLNLLPILRQRGIDAHFLVVQHPSNALKNEVFIELLEKDDIPVHIIESRWPISLGTVRKISKLIQKESFDIVQTNLIHADVWGACVKKFFISDLKLISVKHGYDEKYQQTYGFDPEYLKKDMFSVLTKWSAGYMDSVVSISQGLQDLLVKGGMVRSDKAMVIPYGFDFDDIEEQTKPGDLRYGDPQIIIAGRLVPVKQHHLVLEIMPQLIERFPTIQLVIVGAGPIEDELKQLSRDLGVEEHIRWEGFRSNMHDYIRDSDLMVLPSSAEGFGLVVLEAWQHAKPVIAFDVPAPNEIITDKVNGLLVKPFETQALYDSINALLSDRQALEEMGGQGYVILQEKYSLDTMCDATLLLYEQTISSEKSV